MNRRSHPFSSNNAAHQLTTTFWTVFIHIGLGLFLTLEAAATPLRYFSAAEEKRRIEGGFELTEGSLLGFQGLLKRLIPSSNQDSPKPLAVYLDIQQDPLVQLIIPEGWHFQMRAKEGEYFLFTDSPKAAKNLLILDRRGRTALQTSVPEKLQRTDTLIPYFFIDSSQQRLFIATSTEVFATEFATPRWRKLYQTRDSQTDVGRFSRNRYPEEWRIEPLGEQTLLAVVGQRLALKQVRRTSLNTLDVVIIEIQLDTLKETEIRRHSNIDGRSPLLANTGSVVHQRYLLLAEPEANSITQWDMLSGSKTVSWSIAPESMASPLDLNDGRVVILDPRRNRLFVFIPDGSDSTNADEPWNIDLPLPKNRLYRQLLRLNDHQVLLLSESSNPTDTKVTLAKATESEPSSSQGSASALFLEGIYDLQSKGFFHFPELLKMISMKTFIINSKGQILGEPLGDTLPTPKLVLIKPETKMSPALDSMNAMALPISRNEAHENSSLMTFLSLVELQDPAMDASPFWVKQGALLPPPLGAFLFNHLLKLIKITDLSSASQLWERYSPLFASDLQRRSPREKEELLETLAVTMTEVIRRESRFAPLPASKIANTLLATMKPLFGLTKESRQDFFLERSQFSKFATPFLLSSEPFELLHEPFAETFTYFGIQITQARGLFLFSESTSFSYELRRGTQKLILSGTAQTTNKKNPHQGQSSLPYQELRKDGRLTGLFVISPNLGIRFEGLAQKIFAYYSRQGFFFGAPGVRWANPQKGLLDQLERSYFFPQSVQTVTSGKDWVHEKIRSGEVDYLFKESHSAGSDNVLELARENYLLVGKKPGLSGITELVYILYPNSEEFHQGVDNVIPSELNEWLVARKSNQGKDFVFINSSCWSTNKAVLELSYDSSGLLIEIPTFELIPTFSNRDDNPERNLLDSIRNEKDYGAMRAAMGNLKKSPFILPNEPEYQRDIWERVEGNALQYSFEFRKDP